MRILWPRWPAPLIIVAAAIAAGGPFALQSYGISLVGAIPAGLPGFTVPDLGLAQQLWPGALGIALMSFAETTAAGRAFVKSDDMHLVSGADELNEYESSPGKKRCFCPTCGSHVFARYDADPGTLVLRMGTLDGDPGVRPAGHIWVSDKAPWYEIHDPLPRFERAGPKR